MSTSFNPYDHIAYLTNRVARLIAGHHKHSITQQGHHFPMSCIGVLADLWSRDGVPQKELAMSLIKRKSSIAKMLQDLESANLIYKADHPSDKRNKLIYLTDKGKELQELVTNLDKSLEQELADEITEDELKTAKRVLELYYKKLSNNKTENLCNIQSNNIAI